MPNNKFLFSSRSIGYFSEDPTKTYFSTMRIYPQTTFCNWCTRNNETFWKHDEKFSQHERRSLQRSFQSFNTNLKEERTRNGNLLLSATELEQSTILRSLLWPDLPQKYSKFQSKSRKRKEFLNLLQPKLLHVVRSSPKFCFELGHIPNDRTFVSIYSAK